MTCRELADFIVAYLDGELPSRERAAFERHLSLCRNCVHYLASYKATIQLERQAFEPWSGDRDPRMPDDLVKAILAARKFSPS